MIRRKAIGPAVLLLALLAEPSCRAVAAGRGPAKGKARFDSTRAFADLELQVDFGGRISGTAPHEATRKWLVDTLRPLADEVQEDRFEAASASMVNVIARFRPDARERILLCTHWDTRPHADQDPDPARRNQPMPGANDGASGTAVLVELARMFHQHRPALGVDLVFFDGEDYGSFEDGWNSVLLGSQRYAQVYRGRRPRFGILIDMVGDRDLRFRREQDSVDCCPHTVDLVWKTASKLGYGDVFVEGPGPRILDDHAPLNRAGLGVIDVIDLEYEPWHTTADLPDRTSARSLQVIGEVLAEVVYAEKP